MQAPHFKCRQRHVDFGTNRQTEMLTTIAECKLRTPDHVEILEITKRDAREPSLILLVRHRNKPPDHGQQATDKSHPDHTHGRWHAGRIVPKVQLGEQKAERAGLHTSLNGHGPGGCFIEPNRSGQKVAHETAHKVQQQQGQLQRPTGFEDRVGDLSHGRRDQ
jgi:hypothetical protein